MVGNKFRMQKYGRLIQKRRVKNFHRSRLESILLTLFLCSTLCTIVAKSSSRSSNLEKMFHPPSVFRRRIRSWVIRQESQSKSMQRMQSRLVRSKSVIPNSNYAKGSFFTFERPTKERLFEWFGVEGEDPVQVLRCMIQRMQCNHNKVGITNPLLHVMSQDKNSHSIHLDDIVQANKFVDEERMLSQANGLKSKWMLPVSSSTVSSLSMMQGSDADKEDISNLTLMEKCWWPELQVPLNSLYTLVSSRRLIQRHDPPPSPSLSSSTKRRKRKDNWKVIVRRKRVGKGRACYERVRDAALDWEFESSDGTMGLLEVPATSPRGWLNMKQKQQGQQQKEISNLYRTTSRYTVQPSNIEELMDPSSCLSSSLYRCLGPSSRRLVSYSSKPVTGFLPDRLKSRLYAINPVMVVYDIVDQRAKDCTFTSTAYATLKGHWLSGEERVSVALRDGSLDVDVEILSISRAGPSLWGKALWPLVGNLQHTFFQEQLKHLEDTASTSNSVPGTFRVEDSVTDYF
jgi:uncharacterized protein (UPF0548 family)